MNNLRELQTATTNFNLCKYSRLGQLNRNGKSRDLFVLTFLEHTILSTAGVTTAICCDCDEGLLGG